MTRHHAGTVDKLYCNMKADGQSFERTRSFSCRGDVAWCLLDSRHEGLQEVLYGYCIWIVQIWELANSLLRRTRRQLRTMDPKLILHRDPTSVNVHPFRPDGQDQIRIINDCWHMCYINSTCWVQGICETRHVFLNKLCVWIVPLLAKYLLITWVLFSIEISRWHGSGG